MFSRVFVFNFSIAQTVYNKHMIEVRVCSEPEVWNEIIYDLDGHPLQLWGWGELKAAHNWRAHRLIVTENEEVIGAAQLLERSLPAPFRRMNYIPRGPVWVAGERAAVLDALIKYAKANLPGVILSVEPDTEEFPATSRWRRSTNTILIPRTLILDLHRSEDELLAAMTKKTRQYIRKSSREGVVIRQIKDVSTVKSCLTIYRETAARAKFALHGDQYYLDVHEKLGESSVIFGAFKDDTLVAFVWLAVSGYTAFELYGGMNEAGQELRANYALKWHAITKCKEWGISRYDMNGLLNDGVSAFKQGFADHEDMLAGTYDYPLSPFYGVWTKTLPAAKKTLRKLKSLR